MFKNVFTRFRNKKVADVSANRDILYMLYRFLSSVRHDIVEIFYRIKDRRLREVYDNFAFMMVKLDKTIQFLRRVLNEDLYSNPSISNIQELNELINRMPLELAIILRNLIQTVRLLKEFAASALPPYINSVIKSINSALDDIAKYVDRVTD